MQPLGPIGLWCLKHNDTKTGGEVSWWGVVVGFGCGGFTAGNTCIGLEYIIMEWNGTIMLPLICFSFNIELG